MVNNDIINCMQFRFTHNILYTYLKNSIRPPSWLAFIMFPIPPTCMSPIITTKIIEAAVKTL